MAAAERSGLPGMPTGTGADPDSAASVQMRRLRWRARRGLLENDLLLGRFLVRHGGALGPDDRDALGVLLDLPDGDLLDLMLGRGEPGGVLDHAPVRRLLELLRAS